MDNIYRFRAVQLPYWTQETGVEQLARTGEPKISGNLRISNPFRRSHWTRLFSPTINRRNCNHAGSDTELLKLLDGLCNEATIHFILIRGKKWGERQNVQC